MHTPTHAHAHAHAHACTHTHTHTHTHHPKAWAKISNRTWIWTYVTDFANWVQPWPDYYTMATNIQFYIKNGVTGVYVHRI